MLQQRKKSVFSCTVRVYLRTVLFVAFVTVVGSVAWFLNPFEAHAAQNSTINYQARLLNSNGSVVADGNYHVEFKLYASANSTGSSQGSCSGDSACEWVETRSTGNLVRVVNGYLTVNLGSVTSFGSGIDWAQEHWLGVRLGGSGGSPSWETIELTSDGTATGNKIKITAVPFAFRAAGVRSSNQSAASTNSADVAITTGNAAGATSNSGAISIDVGTATQTAGVITIGTANTSAVTVGRSGITTTLQGTSLVLNAATWQRTASGTTVIDLVDGSNTTLSLTNSGAGIANLLTDGNITVQGGTATLGTASQSGSLVISDGSSSTVTFKSATQVAATNYDITVPAITGDDTLCLQSLANCSGSSITLQDAYNADADGSDAVIELSSADDSLIFRNPASGGTDSTYVLTIDQLATGAKGGLSIQSAGTGNLLLVTDTTSTARDVLTIADGGATTFRNQTDSATAFQIQNAAGTSNLLIADTSSTRIAIGRSSAVSTLHIGGDQTITFGDALAGQYASIYGTGNDIIISQRAGTTRFYESLGSTYPVTISGSGTTYFGNGSTASSAGTYNLQGTGGSGTDKNGYSININGGRGTGTGTGGSITLQYAPAGSTGSSLNSLQTACTMSGTNGSWSCPGAGSSSERFGSGATAAGANSVAIGNAASAAQGGSVAIGASASATVGSSSTVVGGSASTTGNRNVVIGSGASIAGNDDSVAIGVGASANDHSIVVIGKGASATTSSVVIGRDANGGSFSSVLLLGSSATATASNQAVFSNINDAYFGNGVTNSSPGNIKINATGGSGTNIAGGSLTLASGRGTGTGAGGAINFQTANAGSSGSSLNSLATVFSLQQNGEALFKNSANSTTAFQIQDAAGTSNLFVADTSNSHIGIGTASFGTNNRLLVNAYNTVDNLATAQISTSASTNKGLVIQGYSGQAANLFELQGSTGTVVSSITPSGNMYIGDSGTNTSLNFGSNAGATVARTGGIDSYGLSISANWNGGVAYFARDLNGPLSDSAFALRVENATANSSIYLKSGAASGPSSIWGTNGLVIGSNGTGNVALAIQGVSSQSADLLRAQTSTGTVLASVGATGATLFQNSTDSTTGFQVKQSAGGGGAVVLGVDTTNKLVGIGNTATGANLQVQAGNMANLFLLTNTNVSTDVFQITTTGDTMVHTSTDSTTAFQVQNTSSKELLTVDTSGSKVILGKAGASGIDGKLVFNNGTNSNTVTIVSGATGSSYSLTLPTAAGSTSQCLQTDSVTASQLIFGSCSGAGGGDNITVNASAATDANFIDTTATSSVAGVALTLNTGPSPDTIAITVGAASNSVAGVVTATGSQTFAGTKNFSGSVGIGSTTAPTQALVVTATGNNNAGALITSNGAWQAGYDVSLFLGATDHYLRAVYSSEDIWNGYFGLKVQNNSGTVMTIGQNATANVGIGITVPGNPLSASPHQYSTGTAGTGGASTTTVTGSGTSWSSSMVGSQIVFGGTTRRKITAVGGTTSLTVDSAVTLSNGTAYVIYYSGLNVDAFGNVGIGISAPTVKLDVSTNGSAFDAGIRLDAGASNYAMMYFAQNGTNRWHYELQAGGDFAFVESGVSQRLWLQKTTGNVGIGDASPNALLTVGSGDLFQVTSTGIVTVQNSSDSTSAVSIKNLAGKNVLGVDTSNGQVLLGTAGASGLTGALKVYNATNSNTVTISSGTTSSSYSITLPTVGPATSQCVQSDSTTASQLNFGSCGSPLDVGDGSDGAVTMDGTNTYASFASTSGAAPNLIYTLTRDVFATTLTVSSSKVLNTAGYRIFSTQGVTVSGTIQNNGSAGGSGASGGAAGAGAPSGTLLGGTSGGAGGNSSVCTNGGQGTNVSNVGFGGTGGTGKDASTCTGGPGGTQTNSYCMTTDYIRTAMPWVMGLCQKIASSSGYVSYYAGSGGGGGAGGTTSGQKGGGGGGGGGVVIISAPTVTGSGSITANGGNGGNNQSTTAGGAGGGGGLVLVFSAQASSVTLSAAVGSAGTGGTNGTAATTGLTRNIVLTGAVSGANITTLQSAYNNSTGGTTPDIKLDSSRTTLDIQDADSTIATDLLAVRASNGSGLGTALFSVGNTGSVVLGSNSTSGNTVDIDAGTGASGIEIGNSSTNHGIQIGANASGVQTIVIGNVVASSALTLKAGSGNMALNTTSGTITLQSTTSGAINLIPGGTSNIVIGTSDTTGTLLVLDTKTDSTDPTEVDGGMYYNSTLHSFRCGRDGFWSNCGINEIDHVYNFEDEFLSGGTTTGTVGNLNWGVGTGATSCSTFTYNPTTVGIISHDHPGVFQLNPSNTSGSTCMIRMITNNTVTLAAGDVMKTAVATSATANGRLQVGLANWPTTPVSNQAPNNTATSGVYWEGVSGVTNWQYCYGNNNTPTCASSGVAVAANTWVKLEIRIVSSTAVDFIINGTKTSLTGITVDLGATNKLTPGFYCNASAVTSARSCSIDYVQWRGVITTSGGR